MTGWVSLHRKLVEHPRFSDGDWLKVWTYLLLSATHAPIKRVFGGATIELKPGELITSRRAISAQTRVSESKVQRRLEWMVSEQQIEQRTDRQCRLISITCWDLYQASEQRSEQRTHNDRTTGEQRANTHNNIITEQGLSLVENFDGGEAGVVPPCTIVQARSRAEQSMYDPEVAETWWHDCDARGWVDAKGHPIQKWQSSLAGYCRKWVANGAAPRSTQPTTSPTRSKHTARGKFGI